MKSWSRRHTLIIGIALILLTNVVALLGVAWNRSGERESTLKLTQRELQQPYLVMNHENSGISLRLNWRIFAGGKSWNYSYSGGAPEWLDQAKMTSLGFDVSPASGIEDTYRWSKKQLSKEVLLVLEMDGPTYQQVMQNTRQKATEQDAKLAGNPDDKAMKDSAKRAHEEVTHEENEVSRLFAIDAGLNPAELRAKYPDRCRYSIVRGQVRAWSTNEQGKVVGYINKISVDEINVPYEYRSVFGHSMPGQPSLRQPFEASVAFGQRLEPWLIGIATVAKKHDQ